MPGSGLRLNQAGIDDADAGNSTVRPGIRLSVTAFSMWQAAQASPRQPRLSAPIGESRPASTRHRTGLPRSSETVCKVGG